MGERMKSCPSQASSWSFWLTMPLGNNAGGDKAKRLLCAISASLKCPAFTYAENEGNGESSDAVAVQRRAISLPKHTHTHTHTEGEKAEWRRENELVPFTRAQTPQLRSDYSRERPSTARRRALGRRPGCRRDPFGPTRPSSGC